MENSKKKIAKRILVVSGLAIALGISGANLASASGENDANRSNNWKNNEQRHGGDNKDQNKDWNNNDRNDHQDNDKRDDHKDERNRRGCDQRNEERYSSKTMVGKVRSIDSDIVTIRVGYRIVKIDISDATIRNRKGDKMDKDDIRKGDRIMVRGKKCSKGYKFDASSVRDLSRD